MAKDVGEVIVYQGEQLAVCLDLSAGFVHLCQFALAQPADLTLDSRQASQPA